MKKTFLICFADALEKIRFSVIASGSHAANTNVFAKIFPAQVDVGKRKPQTWTWIMRRIRDGNDIKPPRNLIDLISMAQQAQLRREERQRDSRGYRPGVAFTLLAEAGVYAPLIERFRDGKAEHNTESIAQLLNREPSAVRSTIQPLMDIGFLEDIKDTYKVPTLYREGLNITQGKAFVLICPEDFHPRALPEPCMNLSSSHGSRCSAVAMA